MILGITLGLVAAMLLGGSFVLMRKSLYELPESVSFFMFALTGVFIWIPFGLLLGGSLADLPRVLPYGIVSALLAEGLYFYTTARGNPFVSGVVFSSYPVFTVLLAYGLLGERLGTSSLVSLFIVITGMLIVAAPNKKEWLENKSIKWHLKLVAWPFVGAIGTSFSDISSKHIIDETSAGTFIIALALSQIPVSIILLKAQKQKLSEVMRFIPLFKKYRIAFFSGLLASIQIVFFWFSFDLLPASIASPITGLYSVFVLIFGCAFLREKINTKNLLGLLFVIFGVLALSLHNF